jgi:hypothetical protein
LSIPFAPRRTGPPVVVARLREGLSMESIGGTRALRSAFHERRSGARGRSLWTPVGKPASLAFVLSDRDGADVNRHAKWTRIGIHEGPLSWRIRNDRAESARCAGQSRPKPRGGTIAWSSVRSRSQIASNASAVALSCRFSGRASSQAALTLQRDQLGDSVAPTLGATAVIKGSPHPDCRCPRGPSSTIARLAFGIGHRSLADRLAWHGPLRSVTSRNPGHETTLRRGS